MNYFKRRKTESVELEEVEVSWLGIKGKWVSDRDQQKAAWEMYVELVTRVATQPIPGDQGSLREALTSLHALFGETRRIMKEHGPRVAKKLGDDDSLSFAHIAFAVLNVILRPFLTKWHPQLRQHEGQRPDGTDEATHEQAWKHNAKIRAELEKVRTQLAIYASLLAAAAGIDPLHEPPKKGA